MKLFGNTIKRAVSQAGLSAVELVIVIGLMGTIVALTATTFYSFVDVQSIDKEAEVVLAYIQKARSQTINAKNDTQYGVNFSSTTLTLFEGTTYTAGLASNSVYTLSSRVDMSVINLSGGTRTLYFNLINGKPSATGTITYRLKKDPTKTETIILYGSGLAEIQ